MNEKVCKECMVCWNYMVCENGCFGLDEPCEHYIDANGRLGEHHE